MSSISLSILATLVIGASSASDRINQIVTATTGGPTWLNGTYPIIRLPELTPIADVVAKVMQGSGLDYKIGDVETVRIQGGPSDLYFAVLLKTAQGDRVVLLRHSGNNPGSWWSRVLAGQ